MSKVEITYKYHSDKLIDLLIVNKRYVVLCVKERLESQRCSPATSHSSHKIQLALLLEHKCSG
jgi:hypothetical protein